MTSGEQIPFNKPYLTGRETDYIIEAVESGKISGNGLFTHKCQAFLREAFGFRKCLLTTSCTDALEMAAILLNIGPEDEVIMPAYTFVSTANAFVLRGARIVFADSMDSHPNMDVSKLESLITNKTKVIVPVHYAGVACDMDEIMGIAEKHNLWVVEDAAQAIDSFYTGRDGVRKPLGSIGHLAAFSFHETKNIISGEGGMLVVNDEQFEKRAEIIWEKGTNRSAFFRGEVDKYGWVDIGSSFLPSEIVAAFLFAQLEHITEIQEKRRTLWNAYEAALQPLVASGRISIPLLPAYASNNAHMFYVVLASEAQRSKLIAALKQEDILAVFHYIGLHSSPYYAAKHDGRVLNNCDHFTDCLLRLPMFCELEIVDVNRICAIVTEVLNND